MTADGFWFAIIYNIITKDDDSRLLVLWDVFAAATEQDVNDWLSKQPKE